MVILEEKTVPFKIKLEAGDKRAQGMYILLKPSEEKYTAKGVTATPNRNYKIEIAIEAIYKNSGKISVDEAKARAQNILLQAMLNLDPEYYTPFYVKIAQNWEVAISPDEENEKLLCYIFPVENGKAVLHSTPIPVEFVL